MVCWVILYPVSPFPPLVQLDPAGGMNMRNLTWLCVLLLAVGCTNDDEVFDPGDADGDADGDVDGDGDADCPSASWRATTL